MPASWTTAPSREDLCVPWKGHEHPHPDSDPPRMTMAPPLTLLSGPHIPYEIRCWNEEISVVSSVSDPQ